MVSWRRLRRGLRDSARNALELLRYGQLGETERTPFEVVAQGPHHRVRKYPIHGADPRTAPVALLVPPLMVSSEIYDVSPESSAVRSLGLLGIEPYVVDFGAPERERGGMERTLDDHIRAINRAIDSVRELTGRDAHLLGYSQGGMFAYQVCAYRRSDGIRSLVTFGSPVDVRHQLFLLPPDVAAALTRLLEPVLDFGLEKIEGIPGWLTSTGFKVLSGTKEIRQRLSFLAQLHDRNALLRRDPQRRFLGGEGFVAWPGPALRSFTRDLLVQNRLLSGGLVLDGKTVSLADIQVPILCFVGTSDTIARAPAVRAIAEAAPFAAVHTVETPTGHFGMVVGSRAAESTWPTVAGWLHHREGRGPALAALQSRRQRQPEDEDLDFDLDVELFLGALGRGVKRLWHDLDDLGAGASDAVDALRYQEPRLRRLATLSAEDRIGPALSLARQAKRRPEATFFLYQGRAFSYRQADARVDRVVRGFVSLGVRPGDAVALVMGSRPSFLSAASALDRIGAVAVIAPPTANPAALTAAFAEAGVSRVVADPENAESLLALGKPVCVLGGFGGPARTLPSTVIDMESIDPDSVALPAGFRPNPGRARDLLMILLRPDAQGGLRAAPITCHRWALSALGAAAACTLKPSDTVHCGVPLHHPTGILVSVGAAIAGGSRLALGEAFVAERFLADVRRVGATVVFYAGEMLRPLLALPPGPGDRTLPVRLFAGSGIRPALADRLVERFSIGCMEFYASTTQKVILANASGKKPGALGRPLPGSDQVALVALDPETARPLRGSDGRFAVARRGEPGLLAVRVRAAAGDPAVRERSLDAESWHFTGDVIRHDVDGDFHFVDSLSGFVETGGGPVSTRTTEDTLYSLVEVELAAAHPAPGGGELHAAIVARRRPRAEAFDHAFSATPLHGRPRRIAILPSLALSDGFRPIKEGLERAAAQLVYRLTPEGRYVEEAPASQAMKKVPA